MKTYVWRAKVAQWLGERIRPAWPRSLRGFFRWLIWKFFRCDYTGDIFVSTSFNLAIVRFEQLLFDMDEAAIISDLKRRRMIAGRPEHLESAIKNRFGFCPNGRLIALGGEDQTALVIWKKGNELNRHHFPRGLRHLTGDYIVVVAE